MQNQLLLLEDVAHLGRSGDLVTVKPGYARNFLVPQKKAVVADKFALRLQARLMEERKKQAELDRVEAESYASRIAALEFSVEVKVDPDGRLYGSVGAADIVKLLEKEGITVEKSQVVLAHPIKTLGVYKIDLKLKEGVTTSFSLQVNSDNPALNVAPETAPEETI